MRNIEERIRIISAGDSRIESKIRRFIYLCKTTESWRKEGSSKANMVQALDDILLRCTTSPSFLTKILGFIDSANAQKCSPYSAERANITTYYFMLMQVTNLEPKVPLREASSAEIYKYARARVATIYLKEKAKHIKIDRADDYANRITFLSILPSIEPDIGAIIEHTGFLVHVPDLHNLTLEHIATSKLFREVSHLRDHIKAEIESGKAPLKTRRATRSSPRKKRSNETC